MRKRLRAGTSLGLSTIMYSRILKYESVIALLFACLVHALVFASTGIKKSSDSTFYLSNAAFLRESGFNLILLFRERAHTVHYAPTIVSLAAFGQIGFVVLNVLCSLIAFFSLHLLFKRLIPAPHLVGIRLGILCFYFVNPEIVRWNYFILSD